MFSFRNEIEEIINNPFFGKRYRSNLTFKKLADSALNKFFDINGLLPQLKLVVNSANEVRFQYAPTGDRMMNFNEALETVLGSNTLRSTRGYTGAFNTNYVGVATNPEANLLARKGYRVNVTTHRFANPQDLEQFWQDNSIMEGSERKLLGLHVPRGDKGVNILDVYAKSGRRLQYDEITKLLGLKTSTNQEGVISQNIFKRLSVLTSDREIGLAPETPFKIHLFDAEQAFGRQFEGMTSQVKSIMDVERKARSEVGKGLENKAFMNEIYKTMADGESFTSEAAARRFMNNVKAQGQALLDNGTNRLKTVAKGSDAYMEYLRQIELGQRILDTAAEQETRMLKQGRLNIRAIAGIDLEGGAVGTIKGDIGVRSNAAIRRLFPKLSIEQIEGIDVFTAATNVKGEMTLGNPLLTLESHGTPRQARTNVLTSATHQELIDIDGSLQRGAMEEITQHIEDLKAGRLTPGLQSLLDQMENIDLDQIASDSGKRAALESKNFARRLKASLDAGISIDNNEFLTGQLFRAMAKHYTTLDKSISETEKTINYLGIQTPNYELTFPLKNSMGGHISTTISRAGDGNLLPGTMRLVDSGIQLHPTDIWRDYRAFGGFDLDDRLAPMLQYDSTAKRLFFLTLREPNEAGEYMYMNADISFYPTRGMTPERAAAFREARKMDAQFKRANLTLARSKTNEVKMAKAMADRDEAAAFLDNFFREEVAAKRISEINMAEMFSGTTKDISYLPAPKGFARDVEAMTTYKQGSILHSFATSAEIAGPGFQSAADKAKAELNLLRTDISNTGFMPFKYRGRDFSEWHSKYFDDLQQLRPDLFKETTRAAQTLEQMTIERIEREFATQGTLGRASNLTAMIDEFMKSNLRGLPPELQKSFDEILRRKGYRFAHIEKELVIDTVKKTGNLNLFNAIEEIMEKNKLNLGRVLAELQKAATAYNAAVPAEQRVIIGLDPVLFQKKGASATAGILQGYREVLGAEGINDLLLPADDPKAYIARLHGQKLDMERFLQEKESEVLEAARINRLRLLEDITFTPQEMTRATDFISKMSQTSHEINALFSAEDLGATTDALRAFLTPEGAHIDDLNTAALRQLYEYGLFGRSRDLKSIVPTEALDRQLLAISKIIGENKSDLGFLMSMDSEMKASIANLYNGAVQRRITGPAALRRLQSSQTVGMLETLDEFINKDTEGILSFTDLGKSIYDPVQRDIALLDKIASGHDTNRINKLNRESVNQRVNFIFEDLFKSEQIKKGELAAYQAEFNARLLQDIDPAIPARPLRRLRYNRRLDMIDELPPPGTTRLTARGIADETADVVSNGVDHMTRLDMNVMRELWNKPITRKGIIGLGVFAGIGIVYRLAKNPTPEETGGPPLLPGGSPYEDYPQPDYSMMSSIYPSGGNYSSAGMLYTVNTSSGYDPYRLSNNLSRMIGGSSTTNIHTSRRTVGYRATSSRELMNNMIGS